MEVDGTTFSIMKTKSFCRWFTQRHSRRTL